MYLLISQGIRVNLDLEILKMYMDHLLSVFLLHRATVSSDTSFYGTKEELHCLIAHIVLSVN